MIGLVKLQVHVFSVSNFLMWSKSLIWKLICFSPKPRISDSRFGSSWEKYCPSLSCQQVQLWKQNNWHRCQVKRTRKKWRMGKRWRMGKKWKMARNSSLKIQQQHSNCLRKVKGFKGVNNYITILFSMDIVCKCFIIIAEFNDYL